MPKFNNDSNRHSEESTSCVLCGAGNENLVHFVLECEVFLEYRVAIELQRPWNEVKKILQNSYP